VIRTLDQVAAEASTCTRCRLSAGRTQVVFGVGNPDADLMFIGEAPGFHEDKQGIPFVGAAGQLLTTLLRYTQSLITQMAQTAVCNRHHAVDQQLCRWLLLSLDRLDSNELKMTQELIANMLGVRREGVTEAARRLQAGGVIRYSRGKITVLDRARLEQLSCECYEVVKKESDRLLGPEGRPAGPDFHPTV